MPPATQRTPLAAFMPALSGAIGASPPGAEKSLTADSVGRDIVGREMDPMLENLIWKAP